MVGAQAKIQQLKKAGLIDKEQVEIIALATEKLDDLSDEAPPFVQSYMLDYLDELRESGQVNMFAAAPFVASQFELPSAQARVVVLYWMRTYSERHASRFSKKKG